MKKILSVLLVFAMVLSLCSCKNTDVKVIDTFTMIIPYGAGGTTDIIGRQLAEAMEKVSGKTVVVKNVGGASGAIGCQEALDAEPDGSTLLFCADSLGTQRIMDLSKLSYDDYTPIYAIANDPKVIIVNKDSEYNTIEKLLKVIKGHPHQVSMSYTGPGGSGHVQALIMEMFGYIPALIPYTSGGEGILAVMSGDATFTNANFSTVKNYIESGEVKLIAICANDRMESYPDVPALSEVIPNSEYYMDIPYVPLSLLVNKEVPEDMVNEIKEIVKKALYDSDFNQFMEENSIDKLYEKYTTESEMRKFYSEWESLVSWLIYDAGAAKFSPEEFDIARPY